MLNESPESLVYALHTKNLVFERFCDIEENRGIIGI